MSTTKVAERIIDRFGPEGQRSVAGSLKEGEGTGACVLGCHLESYIAHSIQGSRGKGSLPCCWRPHLTDCNMLLPRGEMAPGILQPNTAILRASLSARQSVSGDELISPFKEG